MTGTRPYRETCSVPEALEELRAHADSSSTGAA